MSRFDQPAPDSSRDHMKGWFRMGDTAEGLEECRDYLYRTAASQLSCSGLMCVCQAARDALRARDREIASLHEQLNAARQSQLFHVEERA